MQGHSGSVFCAPKAIPGPYATATEVAFGNEGLKVVHPKDLSRADHSPRNLTAPKAR